MHRNIRTQHGDIVLPAFFPDATRGAVKAVDTQDLAGVRVPGLVVNTFHLWNSGGVNTVSGAGGIHRFMNWSRPVISDSGGFQVMSLIRENKKYGTILDNKIIFRNEQGKKTILTPEKTMQLQMKLGSDIMICLDDCTRPDDSVAEQKKSVERTIRWAQACKKEFERLTQHMDHRPLLFAVIQGGNEPKLRKACAEALLNVGFDGYAYGGFPVDQDSHLMTDILAYTASLMPNDLPKYAMGVGKPEHIISCFKMGYRLFDCVLPTRDARHKRLYVFHEDIAELDILSTDKFYSHVYIDNTDFIKDYRSISRVCDCPVCVNYSRAYLYHLFKANDPLAQRFATIHNLRFFTQLIALLAAYDKQK